MKYRLSRKRERLSILIVTVSIVGVVIAMLANWIAVVWLGCLTILLAALVREPCPACGARTRRSLRWSAPGEEYCSCCGTKFTYDDEPDET